MTGRSRETIVSNCYTVDVSPLWVFRVEVIVSRPLLPTPISTLRYLSIDRVDISLDFYRTQCLFRSTSFISSIWKVGQQIQTPVPGSRPPIVQILGGREGFFWMWCLRIKEKVLGQEQGEKRVLGRTMYLVYGFLGCINCLYVELLIFRFWCFQVYTVN